MRTPRYSVPCVVGLLVLVLAHGSAGAGTKTPRPLKTPTATAGPQPLTFAGACTEGDRIVIAGVGDLLFHEALQRQALAPNASFRRFFSSVEGVLKGADITYGNLEGPAAHAVAAGGGVVKDPGRVVDSRTYGTVPGALIFNTHPSALTDLKAAGFKVLSTANNHAADRGALGIDRTIDALEAAGIGYTGTRRRTDTPGRLAGSWMAITETKGFRVAWLACTYGTNGMPDRHNQVLQCYRDRDVVMGEIERAAADPAIDAVIVTPHWGLEGSPTPLASDRAYARAAIAAGASAVIGTHPHILQPWERIETADGREGLVVYSTGNFVSNQPGAAQRSGIIALLELVRPEGGRARLSAAGFVPTWVDMAGGAGHRVVEQIGADREAATALQATLRRLPVANRVTANGFRTFQRNCPAPEELPAVAPQPAPAEAVEVAAVTVPTPAASPPAEAIEVAAVVVPAPPPPVDSVVVATFPAPAPVETQSLPASDVGEATSAILPPPTAPHQPPEQAPAFRWAAAHLVTPYLPVPQPNAPPPAEPTLRFALARKASDQDDAAPLPDAADQPVSPPPSAPPSAMAGMKTGNRKARKRRRRQARR